MDVIRRLCEGQDSDTKRIIMAAYYRGVAEALKSGPKIDTRQLPAFLKHQAD